MEPSIPDYPRGVTFEQVWALFQEIGQKHKELDEQMKKTDEQMKKTDEQMKKTDEQMKKTDERMGFLSNRFGELAEHLVAPNIHERFNELGYHFGSISPGGQIIKGEDGKSRAEIDLLLENGDTIMAVEVKSKPKVKHIEEHIKRLEILSDHRRKLNERKNVIDNRKVEGAIAGAIFDAEVKKATIEAGLYVIEQSGDTMKISMPDDFVPRRW